MKYNMTDDDLVFIKTINIDLSLGTLALKLRDVLSRWSGMPSSKITAEMFPSQLHIDGWDPSEFFWDIQDELGVEFTRSDLPELLSWNNNLKTVGNWIKEVITVWLPMNNITISQLDDLSN